MTELAMDCVGAGRARLHIEGLGAAVVARATRRSLYRMTVAQPLPFLKLRSGVRDEEGRSAHIESVSVDVEAGTPSLILELVYDDEEPWREARRVTAPAALGRRRMDETRPYQVESASERTEITIGGRPSDLSAPGPWWRALLKLLGGRPSDLSAAGPWWRALLGLLGVFRR